MKFSNVNLSGRLAAAVMFLLVGVSQQAVACGGTFCGNIPVDQAGEQIVFRQEGGETTAMIKIDYAGSAESFGWVLPVPSSPEISLGSDQIFTDLELATRPQFILTREGRECSTGGFFGGGFGFGGAADSPESSGSSSGSVFIEQELSIGAFDAKVISSDDAQALASWLEDNNLDLTDRGAELLEPYIKNKSKFVVLKLNNSASVGSIQPIILKYQSDVPTIPMTLTGVAAQDNMGVLVWLLGNGRGVPQNFRHVIPNYTRLNWYSGGNFPGGNNAAYVSYQNLITEAMNEVKDGHGFATDFAGYMPELKAQLTSANRWRDLLPQFDESTDANFIALAWNELDTLVQSTIASLLPTSNTFVYQDPLEILQVFTPAQLQQARAPLLKVIQDQVIGPIENSIAVFDGEQYITRLYTTLSAEEMTANPTFTFNTGMDDQPLIRNATLTASCVNSQSGWVLTLGEGTDRDGEVVIESWGQSIFTGTAGEQKAVSRVEKTSASSNPLIIGESDFEILSVGTKQIDDGSGGASGSWFLLVLLGSLSVLSINRVSIKRK